jgi:hypothetical protein
MYSRIMTLAFRSIILASIILIVQTSAFADGSAQLSGSASGGGCAGSVCNSSQFFLASQNPIAIPVQSGSASQPGVSANGSASGSVAYGSLDGIVLGSGSGEGGANGFGQYTGDWQDTLTIVSSTLPLDTPVDLLFTLSVDATMNCSGVGSYVDTSASFASSNGGTISFESGTCNSTLAKTGTAVIQTFVGNSLVVEGELDLSAENIFAGSASVDPTAAFFINSATPGASYLTASGASYETQPTKAPESPSVGFLVVGLLALVRLPRKRVVL